MPLASRTVEQIFARMLVRYGVQWLRMWDGVPMEAVAADWANELDGLSGDSIRYGLDHLPLEWPPNSAQFKALCLNTHRERQLPPPKADPKVVAECLAGLKKPAAWKPLDWAYELQDRWTHGEQLTMAQKQLMDDALRVLPAEGLPGAFKAIPREVWPPGMRGEA